MVYKQCIPHARVYTNRFNGFIRVRIIHTLANNDYYLHCGGERERKTIEVHY